MPRRSSAAASSVPLAKYSDQASWFTFNTLTPKCRFSLSTDSRRARWSTQTSTSRGCSETEVKEFAVMPCTWPEARSAVTTVTPVTKCPRASRKSFSEIGVGGMVEVFEDTILHGAEGKTEVDAAEKFPRA